MDILPPSRAGGYTRPPIPEAPGRDPEAVDVDASWRRMARLGRASALCAEAALLSARAAA